MTGHRDCLSHGHVHVTVEQTTNTRSVEFTLTKLSVGHSAKYIDHNTIAYRRSRDILNLNREAISITQLVRLHFYHASAEHDIRTLPVLFCAGNRTITQSTHHGGLESVAFSFPTPKQWMEFQWNMEPLQLGRQMQVW